ncbi:hypothetical protein [Natrialba sp. INN-245]|uniref:hypothetical protein n=1 Tax=Natrialba sp. INN-245 TaxID=2690967 RepID=UPI001310F874|nr:hypothetical protein [Natrialba sp. INN-245]MWV39000.1 hypothetical protein [Natrialba sp. INN-245]
MDRKGNPKTISVGSGLTHSFADDDRAIEGSPIGLVIALIIGVMSLRIILRILGDVDTFERHRTPFVMTSDQISRTTAQPLHPSSPWGPETLAFRKLRGAKRVVTVRR